MPSCFVCMFDVNVLLECAKEGKDALNFKVDVKASPDVSSDAGQ